MQRLSLPARGHRGFSLLEFLGVMAIFAVVMSFVVLSLDSAANNNRLVKARERIEAVDKALKEYYRAQENLPQLIASVPADPLGTGQIPVADLRLDQKYRLDPWGRYMRYFAVRNDLVSGRPGEIEIDPLSAGAPGGAPAALAVIALDNRTLIRGLEVNGQRVAAVLISSGPDQVFDYEQTAGYPETFVLNPGSDDIIYAVDLNQQATQIALAELKNLHAVTIAFNERYLGIDNNGAGGIDEDGCAAIDYPGAGISDLRIGDRVTDLSVLNHPAALTPPCRPGTPPYDNRNFFPYYPVVGYLPFTNDDYNCGIPSLDYMKAFYCDITLGLGNCPTGYYVPNLLEWDYVYTVNDNGTPLDPTDDFLDETRVDCGYIGADYFRIPLVRLSPQPDDCHWGLVETLWDKLPDESNPGETRADQARAFAFCLGGLSQNDIIDPWLNGYVWGCAEGNGCDNSYPDGDPRYHRFFSAGPDGIPGYVDILGAPVVPGTADSTSDDIIANR